jgi:hypothetical protein
MATGAKGLHREDQAREGFAMRKRRLRWGMVVAGLAVVAVGTVASWPRPPSRITRGNFVRIRQGMNQAEVEAILGPPGDFRTEPGETGQGSGDGKESTRWFADPIVPAKESPWARAKVPGWEHRRCGSWASDSFAILIYINDSGYVEANYGWPRRAQSTLDILWQVKRFWRRWFP